MRPTRRELLALSSALLWAPGLPVRAAEGDSSRKFLFVFAEGGWDQTRLFAPLFGSSRVDMEAEAVERVVRDLPFVDHPDRPSVRAFLDRYGDRTSFINGFECRSVAHDVCLRLAMTGTPMPAGDDWPSRIGAATGASLLLPVIQLSGPSYTHLNGSVVVRVGEKGQLPDLISGEALLRSDQLLTATPVHIEQMEDAFVAERVLRRAAEAERGRAAAMLARAREVSERVERVAEAAEALEFGATESLDDGLALLIDAFSKGLARCGMVKHVGWQHLGYDSHADIPQQSRNFEELFAALHLAMELLESTPGEVSARLADEVTIVVMSEMGRYPLLNSRGGKDHWTYTSAILIGSGVRGGIAVGGYDEQCAGQRVDLSTGEVSDAGVSMVPDNLGATLLALAGVDPTEHFPNAAPIDALLA